MLQNFRFDTGLQEFQKYIQLHDTSRNSQSYFRIYNLPDKFLLGKNSIRLNANNKNLVSGSTIYIDIIDANGNPIYHEISSIIGKDRSRLIVANIYANTPPGIATIYIAGRMSYNTKTAQNIQYSIKKGGWDNLDIPNVMWKHEINIIPNEVNNNEIIFEREPSIIIQERTEKYSKIAENQNRINTITESSSSNTISLSTTNLINYNNNKDKYELDSSPKVIIDPIIDGLKVKSTSSSSTSARTTVQIVGHTVTKDWIGARISLSNIEQSLEFPDFHPDYISPTGIVFEAGVIDILDTKTFILDKPFTYELEYINTRGEKSTRNYSKLTHGSYEITYYRSDVTLEERSEESFIEIDLLDIEPLAGNVTQVELSYKLYGSFGESVNLGKFKIPSQNLLVDPQSLISTKLQIEEKPLWDLATIEDYNTYWDIAHESNSSHVMSEKFPTGVTFKNTEEKALDSWTLSLKDQFAIEGHKNTEYKIEFDAYDLDPNPKTSQVDVYVSSTDVQVDIEYPRNMVAPLKIAGWTYIGSIQHSTGALLKNIKLYFKLLEDANIKIKFQSRNTSNWSLSNLRLSPRNELGYSSNHVNLKIPISSFKKDNELSLQINYLNENNKKATQESQIYGLNFNGDIALDDVQTAGKSAYELAVLNGFVGTEEQWVASLAGDEGNDGNDGADGNSIWIRYSDDNGANFTSSNGSTPGDYLGVYVGLTESSTEADYTWKLIKGSDGTDGTNGTDGNDGADAPEKYTWIAYADDIAGATNFTTGDPGTRKYIGIAYNKSTGTEGTTAADYEWSKFVGEDGTDGINGTNGADGSSGPDAISGFSISFTYDDLDTTGEASGEGRYALLTDRTVTTSGDANNFSLADGLLLYVNDTDGVNRSNYYHQVQEGDEIMFKVSEDRWYKYKIDEVVNQGVNKYTWGLELINFVEDFNSTIPTTANNPVTFSFSRAPIGLITLPYDVLPFQTTVYTNVYYDVNERALTINGSTDNKHCASFPVFRVNEDSVNSWKISIAIKSNITSGNGVYLRMAEYDSELPANKVGLGNGDKPVEVQGYTRVKTNWYENGAVDTDWEIHTYTYTPTSTAVWAAITVWNWTGLGQNRLYVREPSILRIVGSSLFNDGYDTSSQSSTGTEANISFLNGDVHVVPFDGDYLIDFDAFGTFLGDTTYNIKVDTGAGFTTIKSADSINGSKYMKLKHMVELSAEDEIKITWSGSTADTISGSAENGGGLTIIKTS